MDWRTLFLTANGRIKRQDFWVGWLILLAASIVLGFIPILGLLVHIFAFYVGVCLYSKRLHDMGRSGFLQLVPIGVTVLSFIIGGALFGASLLSGAAAMATASPGAGALAFLLGGMGGFLMILSVAGLINIAFLIWIGVTPGQTGANAYGPDPLGGDMVEVF
jgi:uncharacterized membrane protein YhaH (DUF805 family)